MFQLRCLQQTALTEEWYEGAEVGVSLEVRVESGERDGELGPLGVIVTGALVAVFCKKIVMQGQVEMFQHVM